MLFVWVLKPDRYDLANWPDLLDYKTVDLLIDKRPLQILSSNFDFPEKQVTTCIFFVKKYTSENCWKETAFKEIC